MGIMTEPWQQRKVYRERSISTRFYRPACYKEEGDLAAIVGDTAAAIAAYNKYLTLRSDPDSGAVAEEVEEVRVALAKLVGRQGGRWRKEEVQSAACRIVHRSSCSVKSRGNCNPRLLVRSGSY
jgi:hypothetical protein